jgi:hypothetical protein
MIVPPGSFSSIERARSAVTKSPGTNSPLSSTKKHRSASPSKAMPRSARSASTFRIEEAADRSDRETLEDPGQHRAGHAVRRVDHDPERLDRAGVDEREHPIGESRVEVVLAPLPTPRGLVTEPGLRAAANLKQPRVAADRKCASADDLHSRVLLRVVRGGDREAAVEVQLSDSEIKHLGADHPDVDDVYTRVENTLDGRSGHGRRRDAHIPADGDRRRLELLCVGPADPVGAVLVELFRIKAANVVGLEDLGVERHGLVRPDRGEFRAGVFEGLGYHPDVGEHRHEVGVAGPPWDDVDVDVVDDPRSCHPPQVPAEVVTLRVHGLVEHLERGGGQLVHLERLVVGDVAETARVRVRRDHEVAGGVRELVQEDERVLAPVHHEPLFVRARGRVAEDAASLLLGALDVLEAPGRPEPLHSHCFRRK